MIQLSAENINRTAPYQVETINELSVSFVTDNDVSYDVGFYADDIFSIDGDTISISVMPTISTHRTTRKCWLR